MTRRIAEVSFAQLAPTIQRVRLDQCLEEVTKGVGPFWHKYRLIGATRGGLAPAKEGVGKNPERYKLVEPGTIFYNPMRILLGSIAFLDEGEEVGITSPDYVVFKGKPGVLHPRWFYYWLRSDDGATFIKTLTRGAVRERMLFRRLATAEIELPSYDAQLRFAQQMPAIEQARAAAEAQLEAAKALPAAYLRAVFDSPEARKWPRKCLGDLSLIVQNGIYKTSENYGQGHPFLRMYNISHESWEMSLERLARVILTDQELEMFKLRTGDLLVSRVNSFELVGKSAWVGADATGYVFENMLIRVRIDESANSLFVAQQMNTPVVRNQIERVAKKAIGQASINSEDLRGIQLILPPLTEQHRIAALLSQQMIQAKYLQKKLEEQSSVINNLPAALLRQAFNGEL